MDERNAHHGGDPEIAGYPEAGPQEGGPLWTGLWAVARHWVALLDMVFEPDLLSGPGITRSFALRCRNWLWSVEGLVRRLIIAAARSLASESICLSAPARKETEADTQATALHPPRAPFPAFAVLPRLPGRQPRSPDTQRTASALPEHRHLVFPADSLLSLFPRHDRRNARPVHARRRNPLHRRGRRTRWDPDYTGVSEEASIRRVLNAGRPGKPSPSAASREPRTRADRVSSYLRLPGFTGALPEWKRVEMEWERTIPAPRLALRIRALIRVMQAPERWIARTARRLRADAALLARLYTLAPPKLRKPKLDRGAGPPLEAELRDAHARAFDTS